MYAKKWSAHVRLASRSKKGEQYYQEYIRDKSVQPPIPCVVHPFAKMTQ